jgi:hypothetical protein
LIILQKPMAEELLMSQLNATLKGTDPTDDRIFIISGHLDSRVTDVMNTTADAPEHDESGVAACELAKFMSKRSYPCTIIFVAVTGENKVFMAQTFSRNGSEKWNIVAMLIMI